MTKRLYIKGFILSLFALLIFCSASPFKGTRLRQSAKLDSWWGSVVKVKYYNTDFSKFTFKDYENTLLYSKKNGFERGKCQKLLKRVPKSERKKKWLAVYDNRGYLCALLSEDAVIADAGIKSKGADEVFLNMFLNTLHLPSAHYYVDNIDYYTDSYGRIVRVLCKDLTLKSRGRNKGSQRYSVKFKDGKKGDNCGHLIPQALNGPAEQINYVPQRRELNGGEILELEKKAINAKRRGHKVSYEIKLLYKGKEKRPYGFENNVKVYDSKNRVINNYTGIFDNS